MAKVRQEFVREKVTETKNGLLLNYIFVDGSLWGPLTTFIAAKCYKKNFLAFLSRRKLTFVGFFESRSNKIWFLLRKIFARQNVASFDNGGLKLKLCWITVVEFKGLMGMPPIVAHRGTPKCEVFLIFLQLGVKFVTLYLNVGCLQCFLTVSLLWETPSYCKTTMASRSNFDDLKA